MREEDLREIALALGWPQGLSTPSVEQLVGFCRAGCQVHAEQGRFRGRNGRFRYAVTWRRSGDPEVLRCDDLTPSVFFARLMGAIANSGPVEIVSIEAHDTKPDNLRACGIDASGGTP